MGILSKNKPATASPSVVEQNPATSKIVPPDTDPTAILFAVLPPPTACPTCHCPQRWFSRYSIPPANSTTPPPPTAWQCEACSPPPLPALIALRVLLVSVSAADSFATIDDVLGIPTDAQQWHRLQVHQTRNAAAGEKNWRRVVTTSPVRCAANCNLLADDAASEAGESGEAGEGAAGKSSGKGNAKLSPPQIFFDATLGKIFHYAEMNGALGSDARPTGRIIYRDLDELWGTVVGDWERVEREVSNYEKFVKPKLGKRA